MSDKARPEDEANADNVPVAKPHSNSSPDSTNTVSDFSMTATNNSNLSEDRPLPSDENDGRVDGTVEGSESSTDNATTDTAKKKTSLWKELPILLGIAIVVALLVRTFVMQTYFIPSESMENTLLVDDRVLVNKLVYNFREPDRGEIVVFHAPETWKQFPTSEDEEYIKRVIAVGGDHVEYSADEGHIKVNGVALEESSYIYTNLTTGQQDPPSRDDFDVTIPEGRIWVMGDHRSASGDSRESYVRSGDITLSTIDVDEVVGKSVLLFWPFDRFDWFTIPETFEEVPDTETAMAS